MVGGVKPARSVRLTDKGAGQMLGGSHGRTRPWVLARLGVADPFCVITAEAVRGALLRAGFGELGRGRPF